MTIGIASPISPASFAEYLDAESAILTEGLSSDMAPAVTTLAMEFLEAGHSLVVFTLDPKARKAMTLKGEKITMYVAPSASSNRVARFFDPFFARNIRLISDMFRYNRQKIDVLSVHWTRDYAVAARIFIGKIPVFVTVRDIIPYVLKRQKMGIRYYNWCIIYLMNEWVLRHKGYNFIANSRYTANCVMQYWGKDVPVIPNPTLEKYFDIEYNPGNVSEEFKIATISISQPDDKRKNILTLLNAFKLVRMKCKKVSLYLIGQTFTPENEVIRKWGELGLLDGVTLIGGMKHDDVLDFLSHTHLMVHPSLEETFGNTLIEAMAVGCPVLGGENSGAVPYVLDHGETGYLCDVTKEDAMADAILRIMKNPWDAMEKAAKAKEYCRQQFSSKSIAQEYLKLFESKLR